MADYTDYAEAQNSLMRRRKLLESMQKQSMEAPLVGRSGPAQAGLGVLAEYLQSLHGKKLDEESGELAKGRQADLASQLRQYMSTTEGAPAVPGQVPQAGPLGSGTADLGQDFLPQQQAQPAMRAKEPNPREAVLNAMASQHPEMKAIGAAGFKDLQPQTKEINGQLVQFGQGKPPKVVGDYRNPQVVNNQALPPGTMGDFRDKYDPVGAVAQGPHGPIMGQRQPATGEVKFAPGGTSITNTVDTRAGNAASEAAGKKVPEVMEGARNQILNAQNQMQSAQRIMELAKDPQVITGFAANPIAGVTSLAVKLGFQGPDGVGKTQALMAELAKQTLANVKKLPGAITEKERPFLELASAGKLDWTPEALQHMAGLAQATAHADIIAGQRQYQSASQVPGAEYSTQMYPMPAIKHQLDPNLFEMDDRMGRANYKGSFATQPAAAAGGAPISLDDYLKSKRGR